MRLKIKCKQLSWRYSAERQARSEKLLPGSARLQEQLGEVLGNMRNEKYTGKEQKTALVSPAVSKIHVESCTALKLMNDRQGPPPEAKNYPRIVDTAKPTNIQFRAF